MSLCFVFSFLTSPAQWSTDPTINNAINTFSGIQLRPHGIDDGNNGAIISWVDGRSGSSTDIYAQRIDKDGLLVWDISGKAVCTQAADQNWLQIATDGASGAVIAWVDYRNGNTDIFAQRLNAAGNAMWAADGIAVCNAAGAQENIVITTDANGDIILSWEDVRSGNRDIYAQKIDINGNAIWAANGIPVCNATGSQQNPHIFADSSGGIFLCWTDLRAAGDAYAQRMDQNGNAYWTNNGIQISNSGSVQLTGLVPSAGGAIVFWLHGSLLWTQASVQRIDANGANVWAPGGVSITSSPTVWVVMFDMVEDGDDGAYFVWTDTRNGGLDGYVQRVRANGDAVATVGGVPLTGLATGETYPNLSLPVCTGNQNVIITWDDARNASQDIYCQKYDTAMIKSWAPTGIPVCTNSATQNLLPNSTVTAANGIITVWRDHRNSSDGDIYCQSVDCSGNLGGLLPVSVLEITATVSGNSAILQWTTEFEMNSDHFEIQRIHGDGSIEVIGKVKSLAEGTGKNHYHFTDQNPYNGINQYRLRQVDDNGSDSYSEIVSVLMNDKIRIAVFPNPATEYLFIDGIHPKDAKDYHLEIFDVQGKLVQYRKLGNSLQIDVSTLENGKYILKLTGGNQSSTYISYIIVAS